ncbi:hypothetical protein [Chryseobacterium sp. FH2]|uniref:hypothetical protein n=1 Tax=Chryseobacterium sp. FH2 TaxID=1674291 RepID=UPI00065A9A52|nr:hypothetical protein [Chryseobacterium sp. FH2]
MKYFAIIIFCFIVFISCKKESNLSVNNITDNTTKADTIKLEDKSQVIFINPTLSQIDSLKKLYKNVDDFYTMADDAHFYVAEAGEFIIKNNIDTINLGKNNFVKIGKRMFPLSKYKPWTLLLYQKGKEPLNIFPINIEKEFLNYFITENNKVSVSNSSLEKLKGSYKISSKAISNYNGEEILLDYFLSFESSKKAILSIGADYSEDYGCEGEYKLTKENNILHARGKCDQDDVDDFYVKFENGKYYIRSKRFINQDWQELKKNG